MNKKQSPEDKNQINRKS